MTIHRRTGLILAGIAVALLVVSVFVVPTLLNVDRYRSKAISYLELSTGKKVEIGRLTATFFPRVTIRVEDFGIKSPPLFPPSYILKVARIDAEIEPWPLLHRQIVIRSVVLDHPVINLISDPDGPWNFEIPKGKAPSSSAAIGVISVVRIKQGHVLVSNLLPSDAPGPVFFEAQEVSSELKDVNPDAITNPVSTTLDGQGTCKADLLRFGPIEAKNLSSNIRLQSRQVFFTDVKAETYGGNTRGEFSIKLSGKNASFKTDATMKRIDVARLLDAFKNARGKMTGVMEGELKIAGEIAAFQPTVAGTARRRPFDGKGWEGAQPQAQREPHEISALQRSRPRQGRSFLVQFCFDRPGTRSRATFQQGHRHRRLRSRCRWVGQRKPVRLRRAQLSGRCANCHEAGICDELVRAAGGRDPEGWETVVSVPYRRDNR